MGWIKKLKNLTASDLNPFDARSALREEAARFDKTVLQPTWDRALEIALGPALSGYIADLDRQAKGNYKPLPAWLRMVLDDLNAYDFDLNLVHYAEGIDTRHGSGITIGYNIYFPRSVDLRQRPTSETDIAWILHELEHVVQYKRAGGINEFMVKYFAQTISKLNFKSLNIHDSLQIEKDAENKAQSLLQVVLEGAKDLPADWAALVPTNLTLGRPTTIGRNLGSRIVLQNNTIYEGDFLQSENTVYRFILQSDGNVVLYAENNEVIWASHTNGMGVPPYRIVAQEDGNVVQYDGTNSPDHALWRTGTNGLGGQVLILQDDRNLVLYASGNKPVWESHTYPGAK